MSKQIRGKWVKDSDIIEYKMGEDTYGWDEMNAKPALIMREIYFVPLSMRSFPEIADGGKRELIRSMAIKHQAEQLKGEGK